MGALCPSLAPTLGIADDVVRATVWQKSDHVQSRVTAATSGISADTTMVTLAWHVMLVDGWKTYWRAPGDVGQPPSFDWTGSDNLKAVAITWPVPKRIEAFGMDNFVYGKTLILPIDVTLNHPGQALDLHMTADFMICETVCIPLTARYRLYLPVVDHAVRTQDAAAIETTRDAAPKAVQKLSVDGSEVACPKPMLRVGHQALGGAGDDIFIDGPDGVTFGRPVPDGPDHYVLPVRGLPQGETLPGLHIVAVTADGPIAWDGTPDIKKLRHCPKR